VTCRASQGAASSSPAAAATAAARRRRAGGPGQVADRRHRASQQAATSPPPITPVRIASRWNPSWRQVVAASHGPTGHGLRSTPARPPDLQAERGAQPRPLQRGEPLHCPQHQHRARHHRRYVLSGVRPAAHRPVDQAHYRGPPDQDEPAEQDAPHRPDARGGQRVPGGPPGRCRPQGGHRGAYAAGGPVGRGHDVTVQGHPRRSP
jgi:hypothetical protein